MKPVPSADGERVNWLNYKTGEKDIFFRMDADNKKATVSIDIAHSDAGIQELYFQQFQQVKGVFENIVGNSWTWVLHTADHTGKIVSRIFCEQIGVSVFNRADWPVLISFFKPRIIALDEFWSSVRYGFETLR